MDDIPLVKLIREPAEGQPHLEDASAGGASRMSVGTAATRSGVGR